MTGGNLKQLLHKQIQPSFFLGNQGLNGDLSLWFSFLSALHTFCLNANIFLYNKHVSLFMFIGGTIPLEECMVG